MVSSRSWSRRLRRLAALSSADWILLLRARRLLGATRRILARRGFEVARRRFEPVEAAARPRLGSTEADHVASIVGLAARLSRHPFTCLPRSLVLCRLLRERGAEAVLRIGVNREQGFTAHAWVELNGRPVGEPDPEHRFLTLHDIAAPHR